MEDMTERNTVSIASRRFHLVPLPFGPLSRIFLAMLMPSARFFLLPRGLAWWRATLGLFGLRLGLIRVFGFVTITGSSGFLVSILFTGGTFIVGITLFGFTFFRR